MAEARSADLEASDLGGLALLEAGVSLKHKLDNVTGLQLHPILNLQAQTWVKEAVQGLEFRSKRICRCVTGSYRQPV